MNTKTIKLSTAITLGLIAIIVGLIAFLPNFVNAIENQSSTNPVKTNETVIKVFDKNDVEKGTYDNLLEACNNAESGYKVRIDTSGTYTLPNILLDYKVCSGTNANVVIDATAGGNICAVSKGCTFEDLTFNFGQSNYHGFQHAGPITMNNCVLNGLLFSYGDMTFNSCTFNQVKEEYSMWTYSGNVTYNGCTFNGHGKFVNVYNEGGVRYLIRADSCKFVSDKANKSAFNVKCTSGGVTPLKFDVEIHNNNITEGSFPTNHRLNNPLVMLDDGNTDTVDVAITDASGATIETLYPPQTKFDPTSIDVPGKEVDLVSPLGDSKDLVWESKSPEICTVNLGHVVRIAAGPCEITAKDPVSGMVDVFNFNYPKLSFEANQPTGTSKVYGMPDPQWADPYGPQSMPQTKPHLEKGEFTFECWCEDAACTKTFTGNQPIGVDTTVYAKWVQTDPKIYTITLDADGSKVYEKYRVGFFSDKEATTQIDKVAVPEKEGYTFEGYTFTEPDTNKVDNFTDNEGKILVAPNRFGSDMTVKAQWKQNEEPQPPTPPSPDEKGGSGMSGTPTTNDYVAFAIAGLLGVAALVGISTGAIKLRKNR